MELGAGTLLHPGHPKVRPAGGEPRVEALLPPPGPSLRLIHLHVLRLLVSHGHADASHGWLRWRADSGWGGQARLTLELGAWRVYVK